MQMTTNARRSSKAAYFQNQADAARRQLSDVQVRIIRTTKQIGQCRGQVPDDFKDRLEHLKRLEKDLKRRLNNALFNAGRA